MRPRLAITLGDPAGIGPEVILKALADRTFTLQADLTIVGTKSVLAQTFAQCQRAKANCPDPLANPDCLNVLEVPLEVTIVPGQGNAATGAASFAYLKTAIAHTLAGQFEAIVTGPIAKSAWQAAGHNYPGQTELLAECSQTPDVGMLFVARSPHSHWTLRTLLATTHIPLRQVPEMLTPQVMDQKLALLIQCLNQDFGIQSPRIAIAGLNPHSGEQGHLGREEQDWLIPWLKKAQETYPQTQLQGPVPPDTLWVQPGQAWYNSHISAQDAYLALYHDQGLIPVKLLAFDRAVNTSIGLPFIRTSPDHGTAFDISGQGIARSQSMQAAIELAIELAIHRYGSVKF